MSEIHYVPRSKGDEETVAFLEQADWNLVRPHAAALLGWVADPNWPISGRLATLLARHTNELKELIIDALNGLEGDWKWACLRLILLNSPETALDDDFLPVLNRLIQTPSQDDIAWDIPDAAADCIEKWWGNR